MKGFIFGFALVATSLSLYVNSPWGQQSPVVISQPQQQPPPSNTPIFNQQAVPLVVPSNPASPPASSSQPAFSASYPECPIIPNIGFAPLVLLNTAQDLAAKVLGNRNVFLMFADSKGSGAVFLLIFRIMDNTSSMKFLAIEYVARPPSSTVPGAPAPEPRVRNMIMSESICDIEDYFKITVSNIQNTISCPPVYNNQPPQYQPPQYQPPQYQPPQYLPPQYQQPQYLPPFSQWQMNVMPNQVASNYVQTPNYGYGPQNGVNSNNQQQFVNMNTMIGSSDKNTKKASDSSQY